jgi:hypothetical protein
MSSPAVAPALLGRQQPRVRNVPRYATTLGPDFVYFASAVGLDLDPWQRLAVDDITGLRPDGMWAAREAAMLVARQNGKGGVLECLELGWLFLTGEELVLHSAHEFKTAAEAFLRLDELMMGSDELSRQIRKRRTAHGEEGYELVPLPSIIMSSAVHGVRAGRPRRLRFVARSKSSGRGFTGRKIVFDEAQQLPSRAVRALGPTLRAVPNPQIIYTFTVPDDANDSEHITSVRDRGRAGTDPGLAWLEWSPEGSDTVEGSRAVDRTDPEVWAQSNPALGIRITPESVAADLRLMSSDLGGFDRELLSIWPKVEQDAGRLISAEAWAAGDDDAPDLEDGLVAFAVDVTPARSRASIGVAGKVGGGEYVEVVDAGDGTGWVVGRIVELVDRWQPVAVVVDPRSPAGSLIPELEDQGVTVTPVTSTEYAQACGALFDAVVDRRRLRHPSAGNCGHLGDLLAAAVGNAKTRPIGDAWGWDRRDPAVDISPLVAVTNARHGLVTAVPDDDGDFFF